MLEYYWNLWYQSLKLPCPVILVGFALRDPQDTIYNFQFNFPHQSITGEVTLFKWTLFNLFSDSMNLECKSSLEMSCWNSNFIPVECLHFHIHIQAISTEVIKLFWEEIICALLKHLKLINVLNYTKSFGIYYDI